jgi:hypothetical protein
MTTFDNIMIVTVCIVISIITYFIFVSDVSTLYSGVIEEKHPLPPPVTYVYMHNTTGELVLIKHKDYIFYYYDSYYDDFISIPREREFDVLSTYTVLSLL